MGLSDIHSPLLGSPGPGPMYWLNPPPIGPGSKQKLKLINLAIILHTSLSVLLSNQIKLEEIYIFLLK